MPTTPHRRTPIPAGARAPRWRGLGAVALALICAGCTNDSPATSSSLLPEGPPRREDLPPRPPGRGGPGEQTTTSAAPEDAAPAHTKTTECPTCVADFALYDPGYEDDGVWEDEVIALVSMFERFGWSYRRVGSQELDDGVLGAGDDRRFRGLIAPGGWAWIRNRAITPAGEDAIRDFVSSGGNLVGFCAGAYWAADHVEFAEGDRDYRTYDYDLALWPGEAQGPLAWMPWSGGTNADLVAVAMDTSNPTLAAIGVPAEVRLFYAGGPWFLADTPPADLEVWGRAMAPAHSAGADGDGEATIVRYHLGSGNVILFAYHPEILIDSEVDGVTLQALYPEQQIPWDTGGLPMDDVNLQSWNVAHAALQIAADENPTPLTRLP